MDLKADFPSVFFLSLSTNVPVFCSQYPVFSFINFFVFVLKFIISLINLAKSSLFLISLKPANSVWWCGQE